MLRLGNHFLDHNSRIRKSISFMIAHGSALGFAVANEITERSNSCCRDVGLLSDWWGSEREARIYRGEAGSHHAHHLTSSRNAFLISYSVASFVCNFVAYFFQGKWWQLFGRCCWSGWDNRLAEIGLFIAHNYTGFLKKWSFQNFTKIIRCRISEGKDKFVMPSLRDHDVCPSIVPQHGQPKEKKNEAP